MGNKWVRRLIFLAFAVMVAVAIYGVTNMRTGITADEITPTDSHLIVSLNVYREEDVLPISLFELL